MTRHSILLVETEPTTRFCLSRLLEQDGHGVTVADDVDTALAAVERTAPDIILLDEPTSGVDAETAATVTEVEEAAAATAATALEADASASAAADDVSIGPPGVSDDASAK